MQIRQAKNQDIEIIETLYFNKIEQLAQQGLRQWEKEEVTWKEMSQEYDISNFYLVYQKDKAVGAFVIIDYDPTYWLEDQPQEALYIHKVMVDDSVKKQGISDAILTFFKEEGKRRGYPVVKLDVREHKEKLRSFYERNGFKLVRIVDLHKGYLTALYEYRL